MPGRKRPGPSVKDKKMYEGLRKSGESKQKSARIANAAAASSRSRVGKRGGTSGSYDDWTKTDLYARAKSIGIEGRSTMTKRQLIISLRNS
ncbi:MAG: DUF7218 family protein [Nocardioidaceae bacterium]